jgi:hypothetical protein
LINLNKQYILNPSDSLNKDMEKTEMELKILREKKVNGIITRAKAKWNSFFKVMPFLKITEIAGTFFPFDLPFFFCPCYNNIYLFLSQDF